MYCKNCGEELRDGFIACPKCGALVGGEAFGGGGYQQSPVSYRNAKNAQFWINVLKTVSYIILALSALSGLIVGIVIIGLAAKTGDADDVFLAAVIGLMIFALCFVTGLVGVCKNMIFANMAKDTNAIAKSTAESNKEQQKSY